MIEGIHFNCGNFPFPIHSVLVFYQGKLIQNDYFYPCTEETPHRMFSITKSFTALAAAALAAEGKLSLQDPIIRYFPDFTPDHPHQWLADMTVQNMLDMKTCHKTTTYKNNLNENWVRSFFITPPDHRPGQIFKYDTSSPHVLCALVKRLTGMGILDYLRTVYLDEIGFSKDAHVLLDPFGDEIGGSGLIARPSDLLSVSKLLMSFCQGDWKKKYSFLFHGQYDEAFYARYADLICSCMSLRSPTMHEGKTFDECQGYGSQFWQIRNGIMMYGMGGQYALFYPEEDLIIVTTADTQTIQGGCQLILDEACRIDSILRKEEGRAPAPVSFPDRPREYGDVSALKEVLEIYGGSYQFLKNENGFLSITIQSDEVSLKHEDCTYRFPVSAGKTIETIDPKHFQKLYVNTSATNDKGLYIHAQILDENVGSIRILIHGGREHISVYLRKVEEFLYPEFSGILEAERIL